MSREDKIPAGVVIGTGVGAAYLLYRLLGSGGGLGAGGRISAGRWAGASIDEHPIKALVRPSLDQPSQTVIEMNGEVISVSDLIRRIADGKRRDVIIKVRGDTREEGWAKIRDALTSAGIHVLLAQGG